VGRIGSLKWAPRFVALAKTGVNERRRELAS